MTWRVGVNGRLAAARAGLGALLHAVPGLGIALAGVVITAAVVVARRAEPAGDLPAPLAAALAQAYPGRAIVMSCAVPSTAGRPLEAVAAVARTPTDGDYVALRSDRPAQRLASYSGRPELACHTPASALELDRSIRGTATVEGGVTPRASGLVACGFVESTRARCWQFDAAEQGYTEVGGWTP